LLPLFVAAGAAGPRASVDVLNGGFTHGVLSMESYVFGARAKQPLLKFKGSRLMRDPIKVNVPEGAIDRLIPLFHGVGSTPESLMPIGARLGKEFPSAAVISVASPDASDMGTGCQWFSVRGITEDNRAGRKAETMQRFVNCIRSMQLETGTSPAQTVLIGFSQGAIMSLESTQVGGRLADRVVSLAGRFAKPPERAPVGTALHFIHGTNDPVIAYGCAVSAAERLIELGADVTVDIVPAACSRHQCGSGRIARQAPQGACRRAQLSRRGCINRAAPLPHKPPVDRRHSAHVG
jgi:phospholipase/carboxylesterase